MVHNASILNAVGCCGLQLYSFGEVVSIAFWTDSWRPDSFYDKISQNRDRGLHTLCLLDIKVKEQSTENLMRFDTIFWGLLTDREGFSGRQIFEPSRFMTCAIAALQLLEIVRDRRKAGETLGTFMLYFYSDPNFSV